MKPDKLAAKSKKELLDLARKQGIPGRSAMSKEELIRALTKASPSGAIGPKAVPPPPPAGRPSQGDRPPSPKRPPREPSRPPRRKVPPVDPAMKLSRVEEIRMSSPGRRPGRPGPKSGPRSPKPDSQHGRRPGSGREPRSRQRGGAHRGWDQERRPDRRDRGDDRARKPGGRIDERTLQAREHHRRSGEGRRQDGYAPHPDRSSKEPRRIEPPRPASIPEHLARKITPGERIDGRHPEATASTERRNDLPDRYGIDRLVMMVRDPYWLHAYWEVTPESVRRAEEQLGDRWEGHRWILRVHVFDETGGQAAREHFDIDLNREARNWYLRVPHPDRSYQGTIGVITRDGTFFPFARSSRVRTPRDRVSDLEDVEWSTTPEKADRIYSLSGGDASGRSSDAMSGIHPSAESNVGFSGMLGSMGADRPSGKRPRGFWLQANTELIVYGATEPDAELTVQGRPVPLRPDGTFTLRFQLPDGVQEIPCVAKSSDGQSERTITQVVRRQTQSSQREPASEPETGI